MKGDSEYLALKMGVCSFAGVYAEETRFLHLDFGSMTLKISIILKTNIE